MDESDAALTVERLTHRLQTRLFHRLGSFDKEKLLVNKLQGLVTNIKWTPADAAQLFEALLNRFESTTQDRSHLSLWMLKMLHCIEINFITPSWTSKGQTGKTLIELVKDESVTNQHLEKCLADDTEKQLDEILQEMLQEKLNQINEDLLDKVRDIVSSVATGRISSNDQSPQSALKRDLLRLCHAAEETQEIRPRLTQMVSWCLMALSTAGWLIQVGTGEGKSCIVAMFAAFRAMKGDKVDVMSSSRVLAERDSNKWRTFYERLAISVDCNTNKEEKDLKKCYDCQVVYGTVEEFAGDWLKQRFMRKDIFGERKSQCAIVDEVDSLMLDRGDHTVYLGTDMPAFQHLSPLLAFIWATTNQFSKIGTQTIVGRKYHFHQVVLKYIATGKGVDEFTILQMAEDTGLLAKGSVSDLKRNPSLLTEKTTRVTVEKLVVFFKAVERKFPPCRFALHRMDNGTIEELNQELQSENGGTQRVPLLLTGGGFCQYMYTDEESTHRASEEEIKAALHFTPCEPTKDERCCYIPGFLSGVVESKLKVWIENAFHAQTMTKGHQYVMERHGITPVDYSCTGVVENLTKWTDGLHQFLELKHKSKLSDMTVITNYMANVSLLLEYKDQIYGVSGTLGQQVEIETLQKIYKGIKTCVIPSFKRRKLYEVEGLIVDNEKDWTEKILSVVTAEIKPSHHRQERAVLIICETINRAQMLYDRLGAEVQHKKLYINNNMDNTAIFTKELDAEEVIIATNLAGRGTDLQISEKVKAAGGLFVIQTFLPENARVEAQAFGRAARQGSPGSAQLIVCSGHLSESLRLLLLPKKIGSFSENIIDATPSIIFVLSLWSYQRGQRDVRSEHMSEQLSLVLSKNSKSRMKTAKQVRDYLVAERLDRYLMHDIPNIKMKQELFSQYLVTLDELYKSSKNKPAASKLSALNESWGVWLLTSFKEDDSFSELKSRLGEHLKTATQTLQRRESPSSNLHHYTAFGNELRKEKSLAESIKMYTKAIQLDHSWAAIAYYNRAFASLNLQDQRQDPDCIRGALEDLQNALKSVDLYCEQNDVTLSCATQQTAGPDCASVSRLETHLRAKRQVWLFFTTNIKNAINKIRTARQLCKSLKVERNIFIFLVKVQDFFEVFTELMNLEALGLNHLYSLELASSSSTCSIF